MKFSIENKTGENIGVLMRKLQYHFLCTDEKTGELNFVRSLGQDFYPRFHLYIKENKDTGKISFNLHLDQKRPHYKGTPAHSGEHEGKVIEKEAERIREFFEV